MSRVVETELDEREANMLGNFELGDVVKLKTGGASMIVARRVGERYAQATGFDYGIHCVWLDDRNRLQTGVFFAPMITHCGSAA